MARKKKVEANEEMIEVDGVLVSKKAWDAILDLEDPLPPKIRALRDFLGVSREEIEESASDIFMVDDAEYRVLTDEEADAAFAASIEDSIERFDPDFLEHCTKIPAIMFSAVAESGQANEAVKQAIEATCGMKAVAEAAARDYGRGNELAPHDGVEENVRVGSNTFFIYRTN